MKKHGGRERGHTDGKASRGTAARSSGSPRHTEMVGPGPVAGAGEYEAKGPGRSAESRVGMSADMYPSEKTPSGPKKVPNRTRGQDEDGD